jgi:glucan endo-1,3-alpha-glucosidase
MNRTLSLCVTFIASRRFRRTLTVTAAVMAVAGLPCRAQRMVFADYMMALQDYQGDTDPTQEAKIASYEREIREAQALGIDGFTLDSELWLHAPSYDYPTPRYIKFVAQMFEAAARLNSGFKLMISADMALNNVMSKADVEDMVRRFANNPRYSPYVFRYQGKVVLETWAGGVRGLGFWQTVKHDLGTGEHPSTETAPTVLPAASGPPNNAPVPIFLVTMFYWGPNNPIYAPTKSDVQQGFDTWKSVIDGAFYWDTSCIPGSGTSDDCVNASDAYAQVLHKAGKLYVAGVVPQFWGAIHHMYFEYSGGQGMRAMWMDLIERAHPEWAEIITWNDFTEAHYISPIDDPNKYPGANWITSFGIPKNQMHFFHSHAGTAKLMAYYIEWYKTGVQPAITRDRVYWFYRTQPVGYDAGTPPVNQKFGPVADRIYVTSNLTTPADLEVRCGGAVSTLHLPAGSADNSVPFAPGPPPTFRLVRNGTQVEAGQGNDPIEAAPKYNNYTYSTGWMEQ